MFKSEFYFGQLMQIKIFFIDFFIVLLECSIPKINDFKIKNIGQWKIVETRHIMQFLKALELLYLPIYLV